MFGRTIKSLVKSGVRDIKEKFSKDNKDDEFPTPFGLRIGAAVDIDTLPLRMHAADLHLKLPEATMMIVAQGYIDLGDEEKQEFRKVCQKKTKLLVHSSLPISSTVTPSPVARDNVSCERLISLLGSRFRGPRRPSAPRSVRLRRLQPKPTDTRSFCPAPNCAHTA